MADYLHTDGRVLRLGRKAVKTDSRTLKLSRILKALPPPPEQDDVDSHIGKIVDNFMFGNDVYGDCVMAERAHQTLRFETFEQGNEISISDSDVTTEYFKESNGQDSGLVILDSLNEWRQAGWTAGGKSYTIHAFASLNLVNHDELKYAVNLLYGSPIGIALPISAQSQVGGIWDVDNGPSGVPGSWGGHCVYVLAYNAIGPVCVTWGARQQMTWAFWDKYVDESYGVVDNRDSWLATDPLDIATLDNYLAEVTGLPVPPPAPPHKRCFNCARATKLLVNSGLILPYKLDPRP